MFGGFFSPSEVRNGNVTIATAGHILGSSSGIVRSWGCPSPSAQPVGCKGLGCSSPHTPEPCSRGALGACRVTGMRYTMVKGSQTPMGWGLCSWTLLTTSTPPGFFILPALFPCRARCSLHPSGCVLPGMERQWDLTLLTQRGAPRCPKPPGKSS